MGLIQKCRPYTAQQIKFQLPYGKRGDECLILQMKEEICFINYKNIKFIQASIIHRCISNAAFQFSKDR